MAQRLIRQLHCKPYSFLIVLTSFFRVIAGQSSVSINDDPSFTSQRICVQGCVWGQVDFGAATGIVQPYIMGSNVMQCPENANSYENSCFCRPDLSSVALSYISTCVSSWCTADTTDVSIAVSVYTAYCSTAEPAPATVSAATTTSSTQSTTSPGQATNTAIQTTKSNAVSSLTTSVGATTSMNGSGTIQQSTFQSSFSTPSSTQDPNTVQTGSSSSSSTLTLADKIGIIIGSLTLLVAVLTGYWAWKQVKISKSASRRRSSDVN